MDPLILDTAINNSPIIVALDYNNEADVMSFVRKVEPSLCKLKVGKELFTACGPRLVEKLVISGFDVFLDLKFHDIPNTVYKACKTACDLGIWMLNVHVMGGATMLQAAREAVNISNKRPYLIGVIVLTSLSDTDLVDIGVVDGVASQVTRLSKLAFDNNLDGVVCSAQESLLIKANTTNEFLTVTPGIRLNIDKTDDQTRIVTPQDAFKAKVDYMVIGRSITQSAYPVQTLNDIIGLLH